MTETETYILLNSFSRIGEIQFRTVEKYLLAATVIQERYSTFRHND